MIQTSVDTQISVTIFSGVTDDTGQVHRTTVAEFFKEFEKPLTTDDPDSKESGPAWSPCTYKGTRSHGNANPDAWALVYDFDTGADGSKDGLSEETFQGIQHVCAYWGVSSLLHTTWSNLHFERYKCRVIIPLSRPVSPEQWVKLWHEHVGRFPCAPDASKIHPGNLFFSPRVLEAYADTYVCIAELTKPFLSVSVPAADAAWFGDVDLNSVTIGRKDWLAELRTTNEKDNTLRKAANALGADQFHLKPQPTLAQAQEAVWAQCKPALEANHTPVKNWAHAKNTCDGGVAHIYEILTDKLLEAEKLAASVVIDDRLSAKAQKELEKWTKRVIKDDSELGPAAKLLGSYAHVLGEDRVFEALLKAWQSSKNSTIPRTDVETIIGAGIAQGKTKPRGAVSDWQSELKMDENGFFLASDENCVCVLENHPDMAGVLGYDVRTDSPVVRVAAPWGQAPGDIEDHHAAAVAAWLCSVLGCKTVGLKRALACLLAVCAHRKFDAFHEYLEGLTWDGTARLDRWLIDYASAEDSEYVRAVSAAWVIAAVARTYDPGCKADNMLVLVGKQGRGKSSLFRALCPEPRFFTDTPEDFENKDIHLTMSRVVISEWAEMSGFTRKDVEKIKHFIAGGTGRVRAAYARLHAHYPRRGVMAGSTNQSTFLQDVTGNRRFWPVNIGVCLPEAIGQARGQLWAEAVHRYKAGEKWWLTGTAEEAAVVVQEAARQKDPLEAQLMHFVENGIPSARTKPWTTPEDDLRAQGSDDVNGRTLLCYFEGQLKDDKPQWFTVTQVALLLGLDPINQKHTYRAQQILIACGFKRMNDRNRILGMRLRRWTLENLE